MHLRVNGMLLEHRAECQQEYAENRDTAKLVHICCTEDTAELIEKEKGLRLLPERHPYFMQYKSRQHRSAAEESRLSYSGRSYRR